MIFFGKLIPLKASIRPRIDWRKPLQLNVYRSHFGVPRLTMSVTKAETASRATTTSKFSGSSVSENQVPDGKVDAVLVDLSGTLHVEDTVIPGAPEALKRLQASGVKVKYVTNTTKESIRVLHERLTTLGFCVKRNEMFTSLTAAHNLVAQRELRPLLLLEDEAKEDFLGISEENPNAVVVGLAPSRFNYNNVNEAFRMVMDGVPLIAIHKGRYYKKKDGKLHLGPGPFVAAIEFATGVTAEVVGKPEKAFYHRALEELNVSPERAVMIGDDANDDVAGAMNAGMSAVLVKTGKYRDGDELKLNPPATAVCDAFPDAVEYILSRCT